jgi:glycosyltransferase involved in cell wall biosynthesis
MYNKERNQSISVIVTAHVEGLILKETLTSIMNNIDFLLNLNTFKLNYEIILALDDPDLKTVEIANSFNCNNKYVFINKFNDLGKNRNHAIEKSKFQYIALIDGDDLWGSSWLYRCFQAIKFKNNEIFHPENIVYFGEDVELGFQENLKIKGANSISKENVWISSLFTHKNVFENIPFSNLNEIEPGDFEDWKWNRDTLDSKYSHRIVKGTTHFVRNKSKSYSQRLIESWRENGS